jgi:serine/threonine protein phosphatase 1
MAGHKGLVGTIFLGDYVDRGPASREVLSLLVAKEWPTAFLTLCGNHEQAFLSFIDDAAYWHEWQAYGALPTLASYGVDVRPLMTSAPPPQSVNRAHEQLLAALPREHVDLMRAMPDRLVLGDYFFCHAGVRPGIPINDQQTSDILTIREPFLSSDATFGKVVVHGHTPQECPQVRANRIGIDTGAYATGRLTALILEGQTRAWLSTASGKTIRSSAP